MNCMSFASSSFWYRKAYLHNGKAWGMHKCLGLGWVRVTVSRGGGFKQRSLTILHIDMCPSLDNSKPMSHNVDQYW